MIGGLLKSTSALAILATAGLLVGGITLAPKAARAADLGGDCCADLEERVANLEATTARKGNRKVSLTITGRVAATMTYWNDGGGKDTSALIAPYDNNSDFSFGDHSGNGPEIIVKGEGKISSDLVAGYYMEIAFDGTLNGSTVLPPAGATNKPGGTTQVSHEAAGGTNLNNGVNDTYVYLSSKTAGTLQLGRVDNAGDEFWAGFNGAYIAGQQTGRFNQLLLRDTAGNLTTWTYGGFMSTMEPNDPGNGIRYISPTLGTAANGANFTASYSSENNWGVGANANATVGKTLLVKAGIGYAANNELDLPGNYANYFNVSAGVKETSSGLFIGGEWGRKSGLGTPMGTPIVTSDSATGWMVEAGWAKNVSGMGDTTLWGHYSRNNDLVFAGSQGSGWQVGVDQSIDAAASHLFLTYENDSFDNAASMPTAIGAGATLVNGGTVGAIGSQSSNSVTAGMSVSF